jgi:hypothetical protein
MISFFPNYKNKEQIAWVWDLGLDLTHDGWWDGKWRRILRESHLTSRSSEL